MRSNWFDRNGRVAQVLDGLGLGADAIVDYTKGEPLPEVAAVFDTLGTTEQASIRATKRGGTVVGVSGLPDGEFARAWLPAFALAGHVRASASGGEGRRDVPLSVHAARWGAARRARVVDRGGSTTADPARSRSLARQTMRSNWFDRIE